MAAIGRATICGRGLIQCPSLPEQHREPERSVGNATLIGPAVHRLGIGECTPVLEQNAEIERPDRVAALVGAPERRLGLGQCTPVREQHTEPERSVGIATRIGPANAASASASPPCSSSKRPRFEAAVPWPRSSARP